MERHQPAHKLAFLYINKTCTTIRFESSHEAQSTLHGICERCLSSEDRCRCAYNYVQYSHLNCRIGFFMKPKRVIDAQRMGNSSRAVVITKFFRGN